MRSIFASTDSRCEPGVTLLSRHHLVSHFSNRFTRFIEFTLNWRSKGFSSRQELRESGKRRKRVKTAFVWESTSSRSRISLYVQCLLQFHFVFHVAARKVTRASKISNMASRRDIVARCCANVTCNDKCSNKENFPDIPKILFGICTDGRGNLDSMRNSSRDWIYYIARLQLY